MTQSDPTQNPPAAVEPSRPDKPGALRRILGLSVAALVVLAALAGLGWLAARTFGWFGPSQLVISVVRYTIAPASPNDPTFQAIAVHDAASAKFPYAPGWPLALPGEIVGAPAVADLLGDGHLEVIVPCYARSDSVTYVHPHPNKLPLVFAFRADGSVLPGWPVKLKPRDNPDRDWGGWGSSPSIFPRDDKDMIAIAGPERTVYLIGGDRSIQIVGNTDSTVAIPIVDLLGRGETDLVSGNLAVTSDGDRIKGFNGWSLARGYCPCIGDAAGDGHLLLYQLHYGQKGQKYPRVIGYDATGKKLENWEKSVPMQTWRPPVMGDIDGSGKMSIVAGYGHTIFAWHYTGKPLEGTETQGEVDGIFKRHILSDTGTPALADLTGSGHADIVVFDRDSHELHAWRYDGKPVWPNPPGIPPAEDGVFAKLPVTANGVSVASLGDDPHVKDFFVGTFWIRHFPDNHVTVTNMLKDNAQTEWTQPTIADLEHTGQADIIFGTTDGRLVVYRTGLAYHADRMQWPTVNGNFQHTGAWNPPKKRGA